MDLMIKRVISAMSRLVNMPSLDPDDARRRKLLNILLSGGLVSAMAGQVAIVVVDITDVYPEWDITFLQFAVIAVFLSVVLLFLINRYWSGQLASFLFLLLLVAVATFSDEPQEVVDGRTLLWYAIPIFGGSMLAHPSVSFAMATLSCLVIIGVGLVEQIVPSPIAMIAFFLIALVSWLAARTMERALKDLRVLNLELDQRVRNRTQELAEAFSRNEAILEGIADGVIVFDGGGKAIVANPAIAALIGWPARKIVGRDIQTLMGDDVNADDQEVIIDLLRNKEMRYPSVKLEWGNKTLSVSVAPVQLAHGEVIGSVAVFRDFTREAEVDRMKSAFVSTASHELRTPLSAILGYADMLQSGVYGPLSEKQNSTLRRIVANTGRLLNLVGNLLDQAQIEAGTLTLDVAPFAPADLINDAVGVMDVLAQAKGLELTSHMGDNLPNTLFGDRQRLHQILVNLMGNAIKFTEQGTVRVRAYRLDTDRWALEVSDTGRGIPPEARSYIFEPFRRADESPTREYTGAGLGLSIVKQLTEMMGGEIMIESGVGRGTTFTVALPLVPSA